MNHRLLASTPLVVAAGLVSSAEAAVSLTGINSPYQQNFSGFGASSSSSMPADWTTATTSFQGFTSSGTGILVQNSASTGSITSGGIFGWGSASGSPSVIGNSSLAWQGSGSVTTSTVTVSFTNNTGTTITDIAFSFDVYQWRKAAAGRNSTLSLSYSGFSVGSSWGFTASNAGTSGTTGRAFGTAAPSDYAGDQTCSLSATGLQIATGQSFSISFNYNRGSGSGNAQGIAIDNFSLTATPAPGAVALLGVARLVGSRRRRDRE